MRRNVCGRKKFCYLEVNKDMLVLFTIEEVHDVKMSEHLRSEQKEPTDRLTYLSFLPHNLIYKLNADRDNDAFVGPFEQKTT